MRGIYIIEQSGDKVTGHYLSKKGGRGIVHRFYHCTLSAVLVEASRVIDKPWVYEVQQSDSCPHWNDCINKGGA